MVLVRTDRREELLFPCANSFFVHFFTALFTWYIEMLSMFKYQTKSMKWVDFSHAV
jgi:hypothetical protein